MKRENNFFKGIVSFVSAFIIIITSLALLSVTGFAEDGAVSVDGCVYQFEKNNNYMYSSAEEYSLTSKGAEIIGTFSVGGPVHSVTEIMGVPYFLTDNGNLTISYTYSEPLNKEKSGWAISSDNGKAIDEIKLSNKIGNGAIVLQTSKDGKVWNNVLEHTNVFEETPVSTDPIYTTSDVELKNGCYYRLFVAYQLQKKGGKKNLLGIIDLGDQYEYSRCLEVYTFCACDKDTAEKMADASTLKYSFDERIKVKNDSGYSEEETISKDDPHYGWSLGNFFLEGFTRQTEDSEGNVIFLINPGDTLQLRFNLMQNLDALNGDSALSIDDDNKGHDLGFEVSETDLGRGALFIQYTDYENVKKPLVQYKDYLAACTLAQADTLVQINEEGDYEVALDYKIKKKNILNTDLFPAINSYKMTFRFSVRNGNCMVYPFDVVTGEEMANSSVTENGFVLDLARSKYLEINVKKEILNGEGNDLIEDTRFNKPAKEGDNYSDEGIYTITARNRYTNQETTKKIYVGNNNLLKAHTLTGVPVSDLSDMVNRGAEIDDDGNITLTSMKPDVKPADQKHTNGEGAEEHGNAMTIIIIVAVVVLVIALIIIMAVKRRKKLPNKQGEE